MNRLLRGLKKVLVFSIGAYLLCPHTSSLGQWVNPKDVIKDPMLARLQQGKKELTSLEKEGIKKYGYTALEIMTYLEDNQSQGKDSDRFYHFTDIDKRGGIRIFDWLIRTKYYYKNHSSLLTYDGIKPGDVEFKERAICLYPPKMRMLTFLTFYFLTSKDSLKRKDTYQWDQKVRKIRHLPAQDKADSWGEGIVFTWDDAQDRQPWEEEHRILGKDTLGGYNCFVIESKNQVNPQYYLSKRVTWVEENNFIDIHEEQFDRQGRLFLIFDKQWEQIKPWNYWVIKQWDGVELGSKHRTLFQGYEWVFDMGLKDDEFILTVLEKEEIWRKPKNPPPFIKSLSDFPPEPRIRWEFWKRVGIKPLIKAR